MELDNRGRLISFLEQVRLGSMNPRIRKRIDAIVRGWMLLGGFFIGSGVVFSLIVLRSARDNDRFLALGGVFGLVIGWCIIEFARYLKERLSMQVDMADSLLRLGSRPQSAGVPPDASLRFRGEGGSPPVPPDSGNPDTQPDARCVNPVEEGAGNDGDIPPNRTRWPSEPENVRMVESEAGALYAEARAMLQAGDRRAAVEKLRTIASRFPESISGRKAADKLRRAGLTP
jgi:xanthosine utilization system XapX-like protein